MNNRRIRWVKAVAAFAFVCGVSWIVAKAADRIFTNPRSEAHLKRPGMAAERGASFADILQHYYLGTTLEMRWP
jgi:hypothetical protein